MLALNLWNDTTCRESDSLSFMIVQLVIFLPASLLCLLAVCKRPSRLVEYLNVGTPEIGQRLEQKRKEPGLQGVFRTNNNWSLLTQPEKLRRGWVAGFHDTMGTSQGRQAVRGEPEPEQQWLQ